MEGKSWYQVSYGYTQYGKQDTSALIVQASTSEAATRAAEKYLHSPAYLKEFPVSNTHITSTKAYSHPEDTLADIYRKFGIVNIQVSDEDGNKMVETEPDIEECNETLTEDTEEEDEGTSEESMEDSLYRILYEQNLISSSPLEGVQVTTFNEAGIMTTDKGLVLNLPDGSEFQLTIVRSHSWRSER
jgi:hypothetical protein